MSRSGRESLPMWAPSSIARRAFLRGLGGAALTLPLVGAGLSSRRARAAGATSAAGIPKRLVIVFSPNGTVMDSFFGPGDTSTLTLGPILAPLAPHKSDLLVLDNLEHKAAKRSVGDPHGKGLGCLLTGKPLQTGDAFPSSSAGDASGWADNISIDQLIAEQIGGATPFRSLEVAGRRAGGSVWSRMSYRGPAAPVPPEDEPARLWERVFATVRPGSRRRRMLDQAIRELELLREKVGGEDGARLQRHRDVLVSMQGRTSVGPTAMQCRTPVRPPMDLQLGTTNPGGIPQPINAAIDVNFPQIVKLQFANIAAALACDLTRIATFVMAPAASNLVPSWLNHNGAAIAESHHQLSMRPLSDADAQAKLVLINAWYAQQISEFIATLKAIPDGSGSLFDSTLVVWLNELASGPSHGFDRMPVVLAGSAQGYLRTGRYVRYPTGTSMNDLLVSIANAMGVRPIAEEPNGRTHENRFGTPSLCAGPLAGLTA